MRVVLGGDSFAKCSVTDIDNFVSQLPVDSSFFYDPAVVTLDPMKHIEH